MINEIWIKHKGLFVLSPIDIIFYREDHNSLCIDFNKCRSQIDIFLKPEMAKIVSEELKKIKEKKDGE